MSDTAAQASNATDASAATPRAVDWSNPRVAAILDAAAKCFARKGFSATTLAEIGKELGLRKSIVHYYFASKAALIHEVQSWTYHNYLDKVKEAINVTTETSPEGRSDNAMRSLWEVRGAGNIGLSIEVWSASRNDPELRRRAAALSEEKRKLISEGVAHTMGERAEQIQSTDALSTLILAVLDGLSVSNHIEGEDAKTDEAYRLFLYLLRLGVERLEDGRSATSSS